MLIFYSTVALLLLVFSSSDDQGIRINIYRSAHTHLQTDILKVTNYCPVNFTDTHETSTCITYMSL